MKQHQILSCCRHSSRQKKWAFFYLRLYLDNKSNWAGAKMFLVSFNKQLKLAGLWNHTGTFGNHFPSQHNQNLSVTYFCKISSRLLVVSSTVAAGWRLYGCLLWKPCYVTTRPPQHLTGDRSKVALHSYRVQATPYLKWSIAVICSIDPIRE